MVAPFATRLAQDNLGAVERQEIELQVEALAVAVRPIAAVLLVFTSIIAMALVGHFSVPM